MVALNKEKIMKLITEIEKTYNDIAPYAYKIAENQAFYNYQADKILSELGVQKGCDLEDEERAKYYDLKSKANVFFNFYASALRISIYVESCFKFDFNLVTWCSNYYYVIGVIVEMKSE